MAQETGQETGQAGAHIQANSPLSGDLVELARAIAEDLYRQNDDCMDISGEQDLSEFMVFKAIDLNALAFALSGYETEICRS